MMTIGPRRLAAATCFSSWIQPWLLREGAQKVSSTPSRMRSAPYTQVLSMPREYSSGALIRCPSTDQPGAGGKVRGVTGPSSSAQITVVPGGGSV
ncbi:hypothetical protein SAMN05216275_113106 [Streptosporangium canum]|uniref:Uncharacterized protein n=2 Tax=Streptosporangium canum TaxID=324952 RepID=A0A1I3UXF8_9ACTN|nr:hypothetical protein SAMN05216275_113106 [Streptosporangium canum]